uniref:(northern house mosquito) hypothetical protein n=1 Tax=Culex pipiens TaxID=7175 RepID=A0A8D8I4K7_CULPI
MVIPKWMNVSRFSLVGAGAFRTFCKSARSSFSGRPNMCRKSSMTSGTASGSTSRPCTNVSAGPSRQSTNLFKLSTFVNPQASVVYLKLLMKRGHTSGSPENFGRCRDMACLAANCSFVNFVTGFPGPSETSRDPETGVVGSSFSSLSSPLLSGSESLSLGTGNFGFPRTPFGVSVEPAPAPSLLPAGGSTAAFSSFCLLFLMSFFISFCFARNSSSAAFCLSKNSCSILSFSARTSFAAANSLSCISLSIRSSCSAKLFSISIRFIRIITSWAIFFSRSTRSNSNCSSTSFGRSAAPEVVPASLFGFLAFFRVFGTCSD